MYAFLNIFFFVFHSLLIVFNCFGYLPQKTRKLNLITLCLTAFSWFVLGIWYGWGFCLCTQWHWQVRQHLGYTYTDPSYTHFLAYKLTGVNFSYTLTDTVTAAVFFSSFALSIMLNIKDLKNKRTNV